ncbi:MAG: hypothetical protein UW69_C0014G0009 [Microgenomates group bacterium GW2011_GWA2_44_7]|nr:MAG: hypothetical protein UW69_C0014G0009 [Microgenomates group bacterium GW2011_GWA2_44_7]KKT78184.1 MAG: hypothetical protein UW73_C0005G0009 [Microgenomates group bacterium GW2011_GWB1_44_8]
MDRIESSSGKPSGSEHHEVRANRFMERARKEANNWMDIIVEISNITQDELDSASWEETAATADGDQSQADFLRRQDRKNEEASASQTVISIVIDGDQKDKISFALSVFDRLARDEGGDRQPDSGSIGESPARKMTPLGASREDLPHWTCVAFYEFTGPQK